MNSSRVPWNQVAIITPSSCQTGAEALPHPRVAQHRPVLDKLADGEAVEKFVVHAQTFPSSWPATQYTFSASCPLQHDGVREGETTWDGWIAARRS